MGFSQIAEFPIIIYLQQQQQQQQEDRLMSQSEYTNTHIGQSYIDSSFNEGFSQILSLVIQCKAHKSWQNKLYNTVLCKYA